MVHGFHAAEVTVMVAGLVGLLALFSVLSIVFVPDDRRHEAFDPRSDMFLRLPFGIR
jgi:hypothetical protein